MNEAQTTTADTNNISQAVVETVAEAKGVNPLELTTPLYEVIDPDALDHLFATASTDGRMDGKITFDYSGYEVTVWGSGYVVVEEKEG